jgi:hypothetical protein
MEAAYYFGTLTLGSPVILTDVSEEHTASIHKVKKYARQPNSKKQSSE